MKTRELVDQGELAKAVGAVTEEIRKSPSDLTSRTLLFELLCYSGELDRARRQLDAIEQVSQDVEVRTGVQLYHRLLEAESARAQLFRDGRPPRFVLAPPERITLHLEALERLRQQRAGEARELLDRAAAGACPIRGVATDTVFEEFRDADDLLAPVLEVFSPTGYFWIPWEHIQYLEVPRPKNLRDLLWTPARLATFDGQLGEVFLPNLYPGSSTSDDDLVRLGRKTEWLDSEAGIVRGLGQKLFLVGDDARTLLELGEVRFALTGDGSPPPAPPATPRDPS